MLTLMGKGGIKLFQGKSYKVETPKSGLGSATGENPHGPLGTLQRREWPISCFDIWRRQGSRPVITTIGGDEEVYLRARLGCGGPDYDD